LNMPSSVPFWVEKNCANLAASMPGTGMKVPMRYTTSAPKRNRRRLRISAMRVIPPRVDMALLLVAATMPLRLDPAAGRFHRALRALGGGDGLVLDGVGLAHLAGQDDLHPLGVLGHEIGRDQRLERDLAGLDARQVIEGELGTRGLDRRLEAGLGQA